MPPGYRPWLTSAFLQIYPTKYGDSIWRWCILMSSRGDPKFSLSSDLRRPGSCLHQSLLPVLDPTSTRLYWCSNQFLAFLDASIIPQRVPRCCLHFPMNDLPRSNPMYPGTHVACRLPLDESVVLSPHDLPPRWLCNISILCSSCYMLLGIV
jgi:hypothetical protein